MLHFERSSDNEILRPPPSEDSTLLPRIDATRDKSFTLFQGISNKPSGGQPKRKPERAKRNEQKRFGYVPISTLNKNSRGYVYVVDHASVRPAIEPNGSASNNGHCIQNLGISRQRVRARGLVSRITP